jgi:hypothetical protein
MAPKLVTNVASEIKKKKKPNLVQWNQCNLRFLLLTFEKVYR